MLLWKFWKGEILNRKRYSGNLGKKSFFSLIPYWSMSIHSLTLLIWIIPLKWMVPISKLLMILLRHILQVLKTKYVTSLPRYISPVVSCSATVWRRWSFVRWLNSADFKEVQHYRNLTSRGTYTARPYNSFWNKIQTLLFGGTKRKSLEIWNKGQ